jgi:hypothetical protein
VVVEALVEEFVEELLELDCSWFSIVPIWLIAL